jgi:hypothetical protein
VQRDFGGPPIRTSQGRQDLEENRQGAVVDLVRARHVRPVDDIADHGLIATLPQQRDGPAIMQMRIEDDGAQGTAKVRRGGGEFPD